MTLKPLAAFSSSSVPAPMAIDSSAPISPTPSTSTLVNPTQSPQIPQNQIGTPQYPKNKTKIKGDNRKKTQPLWAIRYDKKGKKCYHLNMELYKLDVGEPKHCACGPAPTRDAECGGVEDKLKLCWDCGLRLCCARYDKDLSPWRSCGHWDKYK
ncbi:hypothetical protein EJ08DRAFT_645612 [Tothia fuscella]|uniref:Uncharacterized protein n=1 Tax=Tothia fuscella TaxID=1048955 RepID=A0A9P4P3J2_9PEZI|nr:hypothetical protein EJ08DRAFT_645612 [Tothia fuscella]